MEMPEEQNKLSVAGWIALVVLLGFLAVSL